MAPDHRADHVRRLNEIVLIVVSDRECDEAAN